VKDWCGCAKRREAIRKWAARSKERLEAMLKKAKE
jgi:hypothetical protein